MFLPSMSLSLCHTFSKRGAATWGFIFGVVVGGFLTQAQDATTGAIFAFIIMIIVGGLFGYLIWRDYPARCVRMAAAADPPHRSRIGFGTHRMATGSDGVSIEAPNITMQIRWAGFARFEETALHLFLYVSPMRAFIIPKRGLNAEVLQELSLLCRQQVKQAAPCDN